MDLFSFKKIVSVLLMPLPITVLLMIITCFALYTQRHRLAGWCSSLATLVLLASSTSVLPDTLLRPVEQSFHQFDISKPVSTIVVLGCGHTNDGQIPLTSQLQSCSMYRVAEAVRIFQHNPQARIITSGATGRQTFSTAIMHRHMLEALGVPGSRITAVELSRDTEEEAANLKPYLLDRPFALVTSASHMPRAMALFEQQSMHPVAAPTEHLVKVGDERHWLSYMPGSRQLTKMERWWYESLGRTWIWLKGLF